MTIFFEKKHLFEKKNCKQKYLKISRLVNVKKREVMFHLDCDITKLAIASNLLVKRETLDEMVVFVIQEVFVVDFVCS